jgi:hypothetical protein
MDVEINTHIYKYILKLIISNENSVNLINVFGTVQVTDDILEKHFQYVWCGGGWHMLNPQKSVTSGFCCGVNEVIALLGC